MIAAANRCRTIHLLGTLKGATGRARSAPDSDVFHSLFHPLLERPRKSFQAEVKNDHGKKVNRVEAVTVDRRTRRRVDCPFCAKSADRSAAVAFYGCVNQRQERAGSNISTDCGGERPLAYANYLHHDCPCPVGCDSVSVPHRPAECLGERDGDRGGAEPPSDALTSEKALIHTPEKPELARPDSRKSQTL